MLEALDAPV